MDASIEAHPFAIMVAEGFLEMTEEAPGARETKRHAAEFAQELVPFGECDARLVGSDGREDFQKTGDTVWGQFDGMADSIQEPAQDDFPSRPPAIALEELFDRDGFLAVRAIGGVKRPEDRVDGGK